MKFKCTKCGHIFKPICDNCNSEDNIFLIKKPIIKYKQEDFKW